MVFPWNFLQKLLNLKNEEKKWIKIADKVLKILDKLYFSTLSTPPTTTTPTKNK